MTQVEYIDFNLNIPKMGYFLLVRHDKGWVGNEIHKEQIKRGFKYEDAMYTHVEIMGGGPYSIRVAPPTTKVIDIREQYKGRRVKIVRYKADNYDRKRYKVGFWAATACNLNYDWLGVLKFRLGFLWHFKGLYFCSESCAWSLNKEYPLSRKPHEWMPAHFLAPDLFELYWEG